MTFRQQRKRAHISLQWDQFDWIVVATLSVVWMFRGDTPECFPYLLPLIASNQPYITGSYSFYLVHKAKLMPILFLGILYTMDSTAPKTVGQISGVSSWDWLEEITGGSPNDNVSYPRENLAPAS